MMSLENIVPLLKGLGIGVAVAAPVGPMSILCMRRTLTQGRRFGVSTGAGIAAGDALYALVAALGLAGVARFMLAHQRPLHLAAGTFLIWLAIRAFAGGGATGASTARPSAGVGAAFGSALLLTLTNPPTIVSFIAIFTALAPANGFAPASAIATVTGVFLGSLAWWFVLTALVAAARNAVGSGVRGWIDRISAAVLGLLGIAEIRRAV